MGRRLFFTALSVLSSVLCAALVGLVIFSYVRPGAGFCMIRISEGDDYLFVRDGRLEHSIYTPYERPPKWYAEGVISLWSPTLFFAAAALGFRFVQRRARQEDQIGFCPKCSYNLTANTSGICPECETPIPANCPNGRIITPPQRMSTDR